MVKDINTFGLSAYPLNAQLNAIDAAIAKRNLSRHGMCRYGALDDNLEYVELNNTACVAALMNYKSRYYAGDKSCAVVFYMMDDVRKEVKPFFDYLIDESFLRHAYMLKDYYHHRQADESRQVLITNPNVPSNYLALANNLLRLGKENYEKVARWSKMVKAGVDKDLAFALTCNKVTVNGDVISFEKSYGYDHSILYHTDNKKFCDVLLGNITINKAYEGRKSFKQRRGYNDAASNVTSEGSNYMTSMFKEKCGGGKVEVPEVLGMMGEVVTPAKKVKGYFIKDINKLWESLRERKR